VSSPIAGRVVGSIANLGQPVVKGDVLVELDSPDLGQAQADEAKARADQQLAEHAFQRVKDLFDNGVAPRKELEQAQDDLARARSEADQARLRLSNLGVASGRADDRFRLLPGPIADRHSGIRRLGRRRNDPHRQGTLLARQPRRSIAARHVCQRRTVEQPGRQGRRRAADRPVYRGRVGLGHPVMRYFTMCRLGWCLFANPTHSPHSWGAMEPHPNLRLVEYLVCWRRELK